MVTANVVCVPISDGPWAGETVEVHPGQEVPPNRVLGGRFLARTSASGATVTTPVEGSHSLVVTARACGELVICYRLTGIIVNGMYYDTTSGLMAEWCRKQAANGVIW